jgi:hypothetical protein
VRYFYGVTICAVISMFIFMGISVYAACIHLLLFQCESVYLQMYLYVYVLYINAYPQEICLYII